MNQRQTDSMDLRIVPADVPPARRRAGRAGRERRAHGVGWRVPKSLVLLGTLVCSLAWHHAAMALATDHDQPINIVADHAEADDAKGVSTYTGNVILTQGTLRIRGAILHVYYDKDHRMTKLVAEGDPAHFRQLPDNSQVYEHAEAKRMEYYAQRDVVILLRDARWWQGEQKITGERIVYNSRAGRVEAQSGTTGKQRVHVTIPQNQKKQTPTSSEQKKQ